MLTPELIRSGQVSRATVQIVRNLFCGHLNEESILSEKHPGKQNDVLYTSSEQAFNSTLLPRHSLSSEVCWTPSRLPFPPPGCPCGQGLSESSNLLAVTRSLLSSCVLSCAPLLRAQNASEHLLVNRREANSHPRQHILVEGKLRVDKFLPRLPVDCPETSVFSFLIQQCNETHTMAVNSIAHSQDDFLSSFSQVSLPLVSVFCTL